MLSRISTSVFLALIAMVQAMSPANAQPPPRYELIDLGPGAVPTSMNDQGEIVGYFEGTLQVFYFDLQSQDLILVPNAQGWSGDLRLPKINNSGQILVVDPGGFNSRLVNKNGDGVLLPTLPGEDKSRGTGLNEHGDVVGVSFLDGADPNNSGSLTPTRWIGGVPEQLPELCGASFYAPVAINDSGEFFTMVACGSFNQVLVTGPDVDPVGPGDILGPDAQPIELPSSITSFRARAFGSNGLIVGGTLSPTPTSGFLWSPAGSSVLLSTPGADTTSVRDVNTDLQAIGQSTFLDFTTPPFVFRRATYWDSLGSSFDLTTWLGDQEWTLQDAIAIDARAQVIGTGLKNGQDHGFVLHRCRQPFPRLAYGAKFRRVDLHGLPLADPSPTGEVEDDSTRDLAYVDMFNQAPVYSERDVSIPCEGGELTIEHRRTASVSAQVIDLDLQDRSVTYPSESLLGPSWSSNLGSRAIVTSGSCDETTLTVIDDVGTAYSYIPNGLIGANSPYPPDLRHSFSNEAVRAKCYRLDGDTIVLEKVFGTKLIFSRLGSYLPPPPPPPSTIPPEKIQDYYRLTRIEDRNGNAIDWVYLSPDPNNAESFLVSEMREAAHPERKLTFTYDLSNSLASNLPFTPGIDCRVRLASVTDPLGRTTTYSYTEGETGSRDRLDKITRPAVFDGELEAMQSAPELTFEYQTWELPVTKTTSQTVFPDLDPTRHNFITAITQIEDMRGHVTTFEYQTEGYAVEISPYGTLYSLGVRLSSASTDDGMITFQTLQRDAFAVHTHVSGLPANPGGSPIQTRYEFTMSSGTGTDFGRLFVTELRRFHESLPGEPHVQLTWSADTFANLVEVIDLHGNVTAYEYESPGGGNEARKSDQPTLRRKTDLLAGTEIERTYEYGLYNKRVCEVDGRGVATTSTLDSKGNRLSVADPVSSTSYEFAPDGFVTAIIDPDGRRKTYTRSFDPADLHRYLTITETFVGHPSDPLVGISTQRVFDVVGNLREVSNPRGYVTTFEYDAYNREIARILPPSVEEPGGPALTTTLTTTYTLHGDPVKSIDGRGNVTLRSYDLRNRLISERYRMVDPLLDVDGVDLVSSVEYGPTGRITRETDPEGNVTETTYDALLRIVRTTEDLLGSPRSTEYEYGVNSGPGVFRTTSGWVPTRTISPRGYPTDSTYDGFGRLVKEVRRTRLAADVTTDSPANPDEPVTIFEYDASHARVAETVLAESGAGGNRTTYTYYDPAGRPTVVVVDLDGNGNAGTPYDPANEFAEPPLVLPSVDEQDLASWTAYDAAGHVTERRDAEGNGATYQYDGAGREFAEVGSAVSAGIPTLLYDHDVNGNRTRIVDAKGRQTLLEYDSRDRVHRTILDFDEDGQFETNGDDYVTEKYYDAENNLCVFIDRRGNRTDSIYDAANRLTCEIAPEVRDAVTGRDLRPETRTEYDRNGNVVRSTDARGVVTEHVYDGFQRLVSTTAAVGTSVALVMTTEYDANDNIRRQILDNGPFGLQVTEFHPDALDRLEAEVWPGSLVTRHSYYRNGLTRQSQDPKGQSRIYLYDRADRLLRVTMYDPQRIPVEMRDFGYDRVGNRTFALDSSGLTILTYDARYRVTSVFRVDSGAAPYQFTFEHDLNDNRTRITYPGGRTIESVYGDGADRITSLIDSVSGTTRYSHDEHGNVVRRTHPNGVIESAQYDPLNRRVIQEVSSNRTLVYQARSAYDLVGRMRVCHELASGLSARTSRFDYDDRNRLVSERYGGGDRRSYGYDLAGNRLRMTRPGADVLYTYNTRNELESRIRGSVITTYRYDANGNLEGRTRGSEEITYRWDTENRLVEVEDVSRSQTLLRAAYDHRHRRTWAESAGRERRFRYAEGVSLQELGGQGNVRLEHVRALGLGGGVGSIVVEDTSMRGGELRFFASNAIGHTVAETGRAGNVLATRYYRAFGEVSVSAGQSTTTRLAYSKERDETTGLDLHGRRYYDSALGRYISRDPAGYVDGWNLYVHTSNDPVNKFDPYGLQEKSRFRRFFEGVGKGIMNPINDAVGFGKRLWNDPLKTVKDTTVDTITGLATTGYQLGKAYGTWNAKIATGQYQAAFDDVKTLAWNSYEAVSNMKAEDWGELSGEGLLSLAAGGAAYKVGKTLHGLKWADRAVPDRVTKLPSESLEMPGGSMSAREIKNARQRGVNRAKSSERELIRSGHPGTADDGGWSFPERKRIAETGQFPSDTRWHHINDVKRNPGIADNPNNVLPSRGGNAGHVSKYHPTGTQGGSSGDMLDRQSALNKHLGTER